jgi:hypothetical protein
MVGRGLQVHKGTLDMQHIKNYIAKIDAIIASQSKATTKIKDSKGLLTPSKTLPSKEQPKTDMDVIASFVKSIRKSREEMKNG